MLSKFCKWCLRAVGCSGSCFRKWCRWTLPGRQRSRVSAEVHAASNDHSLVFTAIFRGLERLNSLSIRCVSSGGVKPFAEVRYVEDTRSVVRNLRIGDCKRSLDYSLQKPRSRRGRNCESTALRPPRPSTPRDRLHCYRDL